MIITYLRSSSYSGFTFCGLKYFLEYTLGIKSYPHNNKSTKGTLCHKAFELLARHKKAKQDGESSFSESEIGKTWNVSEFDEKVAIDEAWDFYTKIKNPELEWKKLDYVHCNRWVNYVLETNDGMYSPMKRTIVQPEQYFDIEFKEDWAKYEYEVDGQVIKGNLAVKGTMDLLLAIDDDESILDYCDFKTGLRKDWNKNSNDKKGYDDFRDDFQLRLYYLALCHLYPNIKTIIMTLIYPQDGGIFSVHFDKSDNAKTIDMIRKRFELIKETRFPKRIKGSFKCSWCSYAKETKKNPDGSDTGVSLCDFFHNEIQQVGIDRVTNKYCDLSKLRSYGDGGGKSRKTEEPKE